MSESGLGSKKPKIIILDPSIVRVSFQEWDGGGCRGDRERKMRRNERQRWKGMEEKERSLKRKKERKKGRKKERKKERKRPYKQLEMRKERKKERRLD